ncbi:unnamed protein product [marine sediment metagenome]|uniref:NYN domain-containing protein n=1 Tax=marine sediment metagenome TaxID=412755 RepID=X0UXZ5_9ZZZZ
MENAAVLIDEGYFSAITKKFFESARVDFLKFSNILCKSCRREITFYYTCMPYQSSTPTADERIRFANKDRFLNALRKYDRFEVRLGRLVKRDDGFRQKGVDVQFALDLSNLSNENKIDRAIIVAGDSDFVPAIKDANEKGVITENVHHPVEFSYHLRDVCQESRWITKGLIEASRF